MPSAHFWRTLFITQCLCRCRPFMLGSDTDSTGDAEVPSAMPISPSSVDSNLLDSVLLAEWEDRAEQGLFRYDVTACPTKLVPGPYGFIAQCNEGRLSKKRPTEFRVDQVHPCFCSTSTSAALPDLHRKHHVWLLWTQAQCTARQWHSTPPLEAFKVIVSRCWGHPIMYAYNSPQATELSSL